VIELQDTSYLDVVATPGVANAAPLHIVSQPGMNTVVVVVDNGRGAPIDLTLRRHGNKFLGEPAIDESVRLFAVTYDAATWEVV
jgi:hypothetical protein